MDARARPAARGEVAVHDEVMYCQNASLVQSLMFYVTLVQSLDRLEVSLGVSRR